LGDLFKVSKEIRQVVESALITDRLDVNICFRKQFGGMVNAVFVEEVSKGLLGAFFKKSTKNTFSFFNKPLTTVDEQL